jgi:hypothetical protein
MYISLADSLTKGFRKWADAHQPDSKIDDHASGGDAAIIADPDADEMVSTPPERPHRPWLVPGEGRL